jgi:hypothetical protein
MKACARSWAAFVHGGAGCVAMAARPPAFVDQQVRPREALVEIRHRSRGDQERFSAGARF